MIYYTVNRWYDRCWLLWNVEIFNLTILKIENIVIFFFLCAIFIFFIALIPDVQSLQLCTTMQIWAIANRNMDFVVC